MTEISPLNCFRFAEEFFNLLQVEPADEPLLALLGVKKAWVKKEAMHPALMEFFGREMTTNEREFLHEGISLALSPEDIKHKCAIFSIAHIVYHCMNGFGGDEH